MAPKPRIKFYGDEVVLYERDSIFSMGFGETWDDLMAVAKEMVEVYWDTYGRA